VLVVEEKKEKRVVEEAEESVCGTERNWEKKRGRDDFNKT
jgi:hypothetical protein